MLLELVNINLEDEERTKKSGLTVEDGKLLKGALTFKDRSVGDVMTRLDNCYFLSDATLCVRCSARHSVALLTHAMPDMRTWRCVGLMIAV